MLALLLILVTVFVRTMISLAKDAAFRSMILAAVSLLAFGTAFYWAAEDWTVTEALYFSVVSLTTVGYGDLVPTTDESRLFTALYLILGVGLLMGFITSAANAKLEERQKHLEEHQHEKEARAATAHEGKPQPKTRKRRPGARRGRERPKIVRRRRMGPTA
jgi:hypothetical protein